MLHFGPGGGASTAPEPPADGQDEADDEDAPRVPGMHRTTPEAAAALEKAAAERRAHDANPDSSGIGDEHMKELKDKARASIEARLVARRKQRRLLRGGDLPGKR